MIFLATRSTNWSVFPADFFAENMKDNIDTEMSSLVVDYQLHTTDAITGFGAGINGANQYKKSK